MLLVVAAVVAIATMHARYEPPAAENASDACESWRYFPNAKVYQEAEVRERMLTLSRSAAAADPRWLPLADAMEGDRPTHVLGAPPGLPDDDYTGPTTDAGIAARKALRAMIEQECRAADQAATQTP